MPARTAKKRSPRAAWAWRLVLWGTIVVLSMVVIGGSLYAARHAFFSGNPRFTLEHIEVDISPSAGILAADIRESLDVTVGIDNLYAHSLRDLRQRILGELPVRDVEVRRMIPNRLQVRVYSRTPVLRLPGRQGLLDSEAIVLPYFDSARVNDLPAITGIRQLSSFPPGSSMKDNKLVIKALFFLQCHREMAEHLGLEVNFIKLEPSLDQLHVYLRGNDQLLVRDNAVIVLPDRNIEEQFGKALQILRMRGEAGDPTSHIDATYRRRIPVRTTPEAI